MYNRYVRNDNGVYQRVPTAEWESPPDPPPRRDPAGVGAEPPPRAERREPEREGPDREAEARGNARRREDPPPPPGGGEKQGLLSGLLGKLKLDGIDSGDLLLLAVLFLLFQEGADEELLIALGLLFIL